MTVFVTGGAGFIGSALVRKLIQETDSSAVTIDRLTYAGNLDSLSAVTGDSRHQFFQVDICDRQAIRSLFKEYRPTHIFHLAAESHVDRSIDAPAAFIQTNLVGTFVLLEEAHRYWGSLPPTEREDFRFLHVSTDEVFGSLGEVGVFDADTPYRPRSPYSASKAGSDHLVMAWHHTFGLPVLVTNCSNNYGPYQFPEKLIPLMILNALAGEELPVYGHGENVRDWLHVDDHVSALLAIAEGGRVGETYLIGGRSERRNIDVALDICRILDDLAPDPVGTPRAQLIRFVPDRPGHDMRYAVDPSKLEQELGWRAKRTFEKGLRETVEWYLANRKWWERVQSGAYRGKRLGLGVGP